VSRSPLEEKTKQTNKTIAIPQMLRNEIAKENQNSSKIKTGKDETDRKQRTEMDPTGEAVKEKGEESDAPS
jgi:FtsZ-binding cell division protein ZapB